MIKKVFSFYKLSSKEKENMVKIPKEKSRSKLIRELDKLVSDHVLNEVAHGVCARCGKQALKTDNGKFINFGCSHFFPRDYMGTRFYLDNLDALCWQPCHFQKWEHDKGGAYRDYMIKKLGEKKFELLTVKAQAITKFSYQDLEMLKMLFTQGKF